MQKILVSACLLGDPVRYNGKAKRVDHFWLGVWRKEGRIVSVCPELEGGLAVPRLPAEIVEGLAGCVIDGSAEVETECGQNVTKPFLAGAEKAYQMCQRYDIKVAILTEDSPSCGSTRVYDGSFSGRKISGQGVTSAFLERHGIKVFNQFQFEEVREYLNLLEKSALSIT
ncbi:DUF523 domain-containing protein [Endozoicomonas sp. 4G]|uniref:DUF523 domain-containing protein n=1 Tax=Endozoicomonas sp. 4G TaxID=2872754 RepID=UPI002078514F|nr:DUF523 domain-containing protein [Endozoicomonas sp. 4G]